MIQHTFHFLKVSLLRTVKATSTSAHHRCLPRAEVARVTRYREFAPFWTVIAVGAGDAVSLVEGFLPRVVRPRRALLRLYRTGDAEVTLRALARSDVGDACLVAVIAARALLTLVLEHASEQGAERPLRTLEFKRSVLLHIAARRAVMADRAFIEGPITELAHPTWLTPGAVGNLSSRVA